MRQRDIVLVNSASRGLQYHDSRLLCKSQSGDNAAIRTGHTDIDFGIATATDVVHEVATIIERRAKPPPASVLVVSRCCIPIRSRRADVVAHRPPAQRVIYIAVFTELVCSAVRYL